MRSGRQPVSGRVILVAIGYGASFAVMSLVAAGAAARLVSVNSGLFRTVVFLCVASAIGAGGVAGAGCLARLIIPAAPATAPLRRPSAPERRLRVVSADSGRR